MLLYTETKVKRQTSTIGTGECSYRLLHAVPVSTVAPCFPVPGKSSTQSLRPKRQWTWKPHARSACLTRKFYLQPADHASVPRLSITPYPSSGLPPIT